MVRKGWAEAPTAEPGFPFGLAREGVHEIVEGAYGDAPACAGFAVASLQAARPGAVVWVSQAEARLAHGGLSGAGLKQAGLDPGRFMLVRTRKRVDALWATEEAARSGHAAAVVAEVSEADFTATRRLSLVSETTGAPILLLMPYGREGATAAQARWRVSARPSSPNRYDARAPGRTRWRAVLERSRNAPSAAGRVFNLEVDNETLSLRMVPGLAAGPAPPHAPGAEDGLGEAPRRRAG